MNNHTFINELNEGDNIQSIYLVKSIAAKKSRKGDLYGDISLADKTGTIGAKYWEDPAGFPVEAGGYVKVKALVGSYNGVKQLEGASFAPAAAGEYSEVDFFPVSNEDFTALWKELGSFITKVVDPDYHQLLLAIFNDKDLRDKFRTHSAAKSMHQAYVHGLLEHTVHVTRLCDSFADMYNICDRNLLLTASLLHDIGKLRELSPFPTNDYTIEGNMLGHLVIGIQMVDRYANKLPNFPEEKILELEHCICAHHGQLEWGSPKTPILPEAMALHLADMVDSRLITVDRHLYNEKPDEDGWYPWLKSFEGQIRTSLNFVNPYANPTGM